ncbi:hypothetical protein [Caldimonas tepidiphila]|uniref:hypothetical protein n=1 Tax=Caldimonas tepidiphila TaxID=2315841 RepID=UPI000E5A4F6F|nr:hypothetical protein [Caldimonas tepidiphila]
MSKSSAALIEDMFQRFAEWHATLFPGEPTLTKRQASRWLSETDLHVLARWTNEAAHEKRRDWRIPLARVDDLCKALDASADERDELMVARLNELMEHDKSEDVPAVLHWLEPMLEEFSNRPAVSTLERQVLAVFNRAYEATKVAHHCPAPFEREDVLEKMMKEWLGVAVSAHADQVRAEAEADGEDTPEERAARDAKLASIGAKYQAMRAIEAAKVGPPATTHRTYAKQRKALMREFSRNLRRERRKPRTPLEVLPDPSAEAGPGAVDAG